MVAGAWAWSSARGGAFVMTRACGRRGGDAWAMLEALRVAARRDPDDAAKVAVELALVAEADRLRDIGDGRPAPEERLRLRDPGVRQVLVRRDADLGAKRSHEPELVDPGVRGDVVERHLVGERVVEERPRQAHRAAGARRARAR